MASLADQLKSVKLKTRDEPIRDFSNPKTAGFMSDQEVNDYQEKVLDVNTECWLSLLESETFPSTYCPITLPEAQLIEAVYSRIYSKLQPPDMAAVEWRSALSTKEKSILDSLEKRLQDEIDKFLKNHDCDSVFVKTSSRSAKDAPMAQSRFAHMYRQLLEDKAEEERKNENTQITCLLTASFRAMRVGTAAEVMDMTLRSERVYQDMMLALKMKDRFRENFVIRAFVDIDVDMEFRGFVYGGRLVALSQYNYLIHSPRLCQQKDEIGTRIEQFYSQVVRPKLQAANFVGDFIIDFAIGSKDDKLWVIEINPFMVTTDAALFSWEHERDLLQGERKEGEGEREQGDGDERGREEGEGGFIFRITTKPRPGSKTMLPISIRALLG